MLFQQSREYNKKKQLQKKAGNKVNESKVASLMRIELGEKLQKYLLNNDSVEIEIDKKYVPTFLAIVAEDFEDDYEWEQVSETLYLFAAKEVEWQ